MIIVSLFPHPHAVLDSIDICMEEKIFNDMKGFKLGQIYTEKKIFIEFTKTNVSQVVAINLF